MGTYSAADSISLYLLNLIPVDNFKLQKILYYIQAVCLVKYEKQAFDDEIQAWAYGPVVPNVYHKYKENGFCDIPPTEEPTEEFNEELLECIDLVIGYYGKKSGTDLITETHSEKPWKEAYERGQNSVITPEEIKEYYSGIFSFGS